MGVACSCYNRFGIDFIISIGGYSIFISITSGCSSIVEEGTTGGTNSRSRGSGRKIATVVGVDVRNKIG